MGLRMGEGRGEGKESLANDGQAGFLPTDQAILVDLDLVGTETVGEQDSAGRPARGAHVAGCLTALIKNDPAVLRQGLPALLDFSHGNVDSTRDTPGLEFPALPHIDKEGLWCALEGLPCLAGMDQVGRFLLGVGFTASYFRGLELRERADAAICQRAGGREGRVSLQRA